VGVDDISPQMLWTRYFIETQWYTVEESILNPDNLSAMILETNGKASISKKTKPIKVRYFFIEDRIGSGDVTLKQCPAEIILGDHFTKLLQGSMFHQFIDDIQGISANIPSSSLSWDQDQVSTKSECYSLAGPISQECVYTPSIHTCTGTYTSNSERSGLTASPAKIQKVYWRKLIERGRSYAAVEISGIEEK
jgi:hypothetical protein